MTESGILFQRDMELYHLTLVEVGIRSYLESSGPGMSFIPLRFQEILRLGLVRPGIGVVGWMNEPKTIRMIESCGTPYLNLFEGAKSSNVGLQLQFEGEGNVAADFFVKELGYEHLAFVGNAHLKSNSRRCAEFSRAAEMHGIDVHSLIAERLEGTPSVGDYEPGASPALDLSIEFLRSLPKPIGIFCANDSLAMKVYFVARSLGISVPDEIGILGVGGPRAENSGPMSEISVIQLDHERQGKISAQMMCEYLNGERRTRPVLMEPGRIAHRATTARRRVFDPLIQKALSIIRMNQTATIQAICGELNVSRRTLENRFRKATNSSVAKAIDFERFNKAKALMRNHRYSNDSIASLAGYANRDQMRRSFHRFARLTPSEYRLRWRDRERPSVDIPKTAS